VEAIVSELRDGSIKQGNGLPNMPTMQPLENTHWKLTRLGGRAVIVPERQREPSFVLHAENRRVVGSSGCNRLVGSYRVDGNKIAFSNLPAPRWPARKAWIRSRHFWRRWDERKT